MALCLTLKLEILTIFGRVTIVSLRIYGMLKIKKKKCFDPNVLACYVRSVKRPSRYVSSDEEDWEEEMQQTPQKKCRRTDL